jgi:hypothetical protein
MGLAHRQEQAAQVIAVVEPIPCEPKKSPGETPGLVNAASFSGGEHAESQASLPSYPLSSLTFVRAARENDSRVLHGRIAAELADAVSARFEIPKRDVLHFLRSEFWKVRVTAAKTFRDKVTDLHQRRHFRAA